MVDPSIDTAEAAKRHIEAGKGYIDERNTRQALVHLHKAEKYQSKSVDLFHAYALLYRLEGDVDREEYYYKKALKEDKYNSRIKNNYGIFLCHHGNAKKGVKLLRDASSDYQYPGRAESYVNLGMCELSLSDTQSAEKSFQQSLRLNAQSTLPYIELANIYFTQNDINSAYLYYQQFVSKVSQQNARSLLLGIKITQGIGEENGALDYVMSLQKHFPDSEEYKEYLTLSQ